MQLSNILAAFTGATPAAPTTPAATPAAAVPAPIAPSATSPAAPAVVPQPVADASFAARLLGKVGESQNRFLANQQLLGAVSSAIGERISLVASNALRLLRGEVPADPS